ncbi:SET domain-containing protein [Agarilytica rhodophyticola]|uniref:SET domain-containing protein n=1 Tax=Agarilytica rhodophyticola TaxID=1737490 RepID=UPI000B348C02|nr:SET domain-containing protein [Agarilytica rhodophyticola]
MKSSLVIKKSAIHGKGLFSTVKIRKGEVIGMCKIKTSKKQGPYTLSLEDGNDVDVTCKLKYINHSKTPNVAYYSDLSVVSLRSIKPGDELTHDYGEEWL